MHPKHLQPIVDGLPLRCQARLEDSTHGFCGRAAVRHRPAHHLAADAYFCAEHAIASDAELPADALVRRVVVALVVELAGVSTMHVAAQNEAVCSLEAAVKALGGRASFQQVGSDMVRVGPLPAARTGLRGAGCA